MEQEKKALITRYAVCFGVAALMTFLILSMKGFFGEDAKTNMQILHDAFFATGALMMLFAGLLYVAGEGIFLGIGYALGRAIKALIPFSRKEHETYKQYCERKTGKTRAKTDSCIFFTGLFFFLVSLIFLAIWYKL